MLYSYYQQTHNLIDIETGIKFSVSIFLSAIVIQVLPILSSIYCLNISLFLEYHSASVLLPGKKGNVSV